jgi:hypothetical protein
MVGADPMGISQSLRMVSLSLAQMDGSEFMPRKDSPFPLPIAGWMAFLAQYATTTKSSQLRKGVSPVKFYAISN